MGIGEGHAFLIRVRGRVLIWVAGRVKKIPIDQILNSFLPGIHKSIVSSLNNCTLGQTVWYDPGCHFSLAALSVDLYDWPIQTVGVYSI